MAINEVTRALAAAMAGVDGRSVPALEDCQVCGAKPPFKFKDELSEKEFGISGMCQDATFGKEDDT